MVYYIMGRSRKFEEDGEYWRDWGHWEEQPSIMEINTYAEAEEELKCFEENYPDSEELENEFTIKEVVE